MGGSARLSARLLTAAAWSSVRRRTRLARRAVACADALGATGTSTARRKADPAKVSAARAVLDFLTAYTEGAGMVARLEAVERAVAARDQPRQGAN